MTRKPTYEELEQRVNALEKVAIEYKQAEEALRLSEAKYRRVSDNSPAVLYQFIMTPDGVMWFPYISDMIFSIMGVTPEEVMQDSSKLLGMVIPDDQKMLYEGIAQSAESLETFPLTFRCIKDGKVIWIEARGMPTALPDGNILWDGFFLDVTENMQLQEALRKSEGRLKQAHNELELRVRKRTAELSKANQLLIREIKARELTDEKLRQAERKYRTIADYTYDWEYWVHVDGGFNYVSRSCERISGYTAQELINKPSLFREIILPEDRGIWDQHYSDSRSELDGGEVQFRIQRRDGKIRWIEHVCQPVFDDQGNYQGVRASNRDITRRQFYKAETHQLQSELAHMDRIVLINALAATLAHEINQPLAAMRSYAQAALRFLDREQPEYHNVQKALHGIVADNKRAAAVINRLRALAKKGEMRWEPIEMNTIINDVMSLVSSEIILRNASITLDLHPKVPVVQGDSIQIQQVLINLLTNALDATDDQPFDVRAITISTRVGDSNGIIVSISDSGNGIPPGISKDLFSPFRTTKSTGMGLGLSVCKSIVKAHGGKIWAENNPDGGAIFSITLPAGSRIR